MKTEGMFYIIDARSCVGNCAMFWGPDGKGYVCDLGEAGLYTLEEALSHRETDVPLSVKDARKLMTKHIRWDQLYKSDVGLRGEKLTEYLAKLNRCAGY